MNFIKKKFIINLKGLLILILLCVYAIFIYNRATFKNLLINNNNEYDLIIPCNFLDTQIFLRHLKFYKKFLHHINIIFLTPSNSNGLNSIDNSISFINEDTLVQKEKINEFLWKMRSISTRRVGWYEQQFLKMAYSKICRKEYYLVWDFDTIPIKSIKMFENGHPFFDMKSAHHIPYFTTIERLIPGLIFSNQTYISEHMMIRTEFMKNLIDAIESNSKIPGKLFWEKILMAIDIKDIGKSGFSEFEIYGSFVDTKYPKFYYHRNWYSKRDTVTFFNNSENLDEDDINWLSQEYHALTFEKWRKYKFKKENLEIVKDSEFRKLYKPNLFFKNFNKIVRKFRKYKILNKI